MIDLLKTLKANHRLLLLVSAASIILLFVIIQRTSYDDALDELQALAVIDSAEISNYFIEKNPRALNSQPDLNECWQLDTNIAYYLSKLSNVTFKGGFSDCHERVRGLFNINFPHNDSLSVWVEWLENDRGGTWIRCEESRATWKPIHPSTIADTLSLVGSGMWTLRPNPGFQPNDTERYDMFLVNEYSVVAFDNKDWIWDDAVKLELYIPAMQTFSLFHPLQWLEEIELDETMFHRFGDRRVILGGIRSLGLESLNLTISGAINRVQQLRNQGRSTSIFGMSVSEPLTTVLAPIFLFLIHVSFLLHCVRFTELYETSSNIGVTDFPWIPLYPGQMPAFYSLLTIVVFPSILAPLLLFLGLGGRHITIWPATFTLLFLVLNFSIGAKSWSLLSKMRKSIREI